MKFFSSMVTPFGLCFDDDVYCIVENIVPFAKPVAAVVLPSAPMCFTALPPPTIVLVFKKPSF